MLREIKEIRQPKGEGKRRWFTDEYFDLIIWYTDSNALFGFQLCYDKNNKERALTWREKSGYSHTKIDDGESMAGGGIKMTPILVPDGIFEYNMIAERFKNESKNLEPDIVELVYRKIVEYKEETEQAL